MIEQAAPDNPFEATTSRNGRNTVQKSGPQPCLRVWNRAKRLVAMTEVAIDNELAEDLIKT